MRRDPRLMKAQPLTLPPKQLHEGRIAQGLVMLLATAPYKEQMILAGVPRAFVQHICANGGQGLRLVKIDDPLDGGLRARTFRMVSAIPHGDAPPTILNIFEMQVEHF